MSKSLRLVFATCLILAPACLLFFWVYVYSENIPIYDDFDVFLGFLSQYAAAPDLAQKLLLLFSQHNEHRIALNRLCALAFYWFGLPVNLTGVLFMGNALLLLQLPLFFALQGRSVRQETAPNGVAERVWSFLPVAFLLYFPVNWNCSFWPTTAVQYYGTNLLTLCGVALLSRSKPAFGLAMACAIAAIFSSGGGLITPVVCVATLLLRKDFKTAARACFVLVIAVGLYFWGYASPETPTIPKAAWNLDRFVGILGFFLTFLRAAVPSKLVPANAAGMILGLGFLAFFLWLTFKRYYRANTGVFMCMAYILANAAAASITRSTLGFEHALAERYSIFSLFLLALYFIALLDLIPPLFRARCLKVSIVTVIALYVSFGPLLLQRMEKHRQWLVTSLCEWRKTGSGLLYPDIAKAEEILNRATTERMYKAPLQLCDKE